jgi:hypothetical protein
MSFLVLKCIRETGHVLMNFLYARLRASYSFYDGTVRGTGIPTAEIRVVIPTRHRSEQVRTYQKSPTGQSLSCKEWVLIVFEDGYETLADERLARQFPELPVRYLLQQAHDGCGAVRTGDVEVARGSYVAFTDDDCLLPPDWLTKLASCVEKVAKMLI